MSFKLNPPKTQTQLHNRIQSNQEVIVIFYLHNKKHHVLPWCFLKQTKLYFLRETGHTKAFKQTF
jgi:hypothetical protein